MRGAALLLAFALLAPAARADITDKLKACFDLPDATESKKCLSALRDADEINRPHAQKMGVTDRAPRRYASDVEEHSSVIRQRIDDTLAPSYFTIGSGIHAGGDKTTGAMLYEAQIGQNLKWLDWHLPLGRADDTGLHRRRVDFWLDVPVRIGVRQLSTDSFPVRTPSFNPGLRLFVAPNDGREVEEGAWYYSLGLHHYSNGQEGDTRREDSYANLENGSFNTNYVEVAAHRTVASPFVRWGRATFRQHFFGTFDPAQVDQYPKRQVTLELGTYREFAPPWGEQDKKWLWDVRLAGTYGWGHPFVVRPGNGRDGNAVAGQRAHFSDRLNTTLEFSIKPHGWNALSLYLRYDQGYDYYNINFQNRINRIQFGFVAR